MQNEYNAPIGDAQVAAPVVAGTESEALSPFQERVGPWLLACFGEVIAADKNERNHRFLEEALELVQSCGCSATEAHQLVDYVFGRPVGEAAQEAGGAMVTLAALCRANGLDMHTAGEVELARCWRKTEQIRAKQLAKPKHSPLPAAPIAPTEAKLTEKVAALREELQHVLADWNAIVAASGSPTNGGAIGHVRNLRALAEAAAPPAAVGAL